MEPRCGWANHRLLQMVFCRKAVVRFVVVTPLAHGMGLWFPAGRRYRPILQVDADNHQILLKPDAPKGKPLGCRVWGHAIPQYRRGHLDILAELERDEQNMPGLYLGGNYRTGVAFGDCVAYGIEEAEKIATFLGTKVKA